MDENGQDNRKDMCEDMGYEVLDAMYELPKRWLDLYKRLTMYSDQHWIRKKGRSERPFFVVENTGALHNHVSWFRPY